MAILKPIRLGLIAILLCCLTHVHAQKQTAQEYQVKAVFLFNFAQFVEWPPTAFGDTNSIVIGVLGDNPFGNYLDETVRGEEVNGHPLQVQHFAKIEDVKVCHILFINLPEISQVKHAIINVKSRHTLTVSDVNSFTVQGGMIRFINDDHKTRIRINLPAVKDADLKISSKLLRLAEIVNPKKQQ
jgi:hypothetical protein